MIENDEVSMKYIIREAQIHEKEAVNTAHVLSIREICSKDYSPEQIAGWSGVIYSDEVWINSLTNHFYRVVEVDGAIEGFCHANYHGENLGEIRGLYFTPKIKGHGIGKEIVELAKKYLIDLGAKKIVIGATKTAKPFYEKMGFIATGEEKLYHTRGTAFEYYPMEMIVTKL
ncbi:MAG: hypothetical protein COW00_00970 [Bdellovibrio sp. CG12_big_fil_rev_8_21_14_0_65_39_13]|nr:MAG: hypothetical protein COW78_10265 [Bdellovibrio sp. CG22_combo_CG10-13_8_21_14_all_39_27]PIQ62725.1 MAG: hypothetical protein COW00_00970 [Bdellovibrio sp. CG12_big_fil_rev_8_21_14_0_65_39_13]PIR36047.1 MAG: hypothetical protein COV37_05190 [Bdellovibrio sp. CG11_big_fil_rev_8_21_14_0_20_39_38]PJB54123.1 MAG: hypothetical protein CO099_03345 [Bdellovibrio sp. CG_4_9_14_3_um_filter_39_7]